MEVLMSLFRRVRPTPMVRIYVLIRGLLYLCMGIALSLTDGQEFGHRPVPAAESIFIVGFFLLAFLKFAAVWFDTENWYKVAYLVATVMVSSWTFTIFVYAMFGLVAYTRGIVFFFLLVEDSIIQPYLLKAREIGNTIKNVEEHLRNGGGE